MPAESYPRYSSRRNPSRITGTTCFLPTYPTIPHIERLKTGTSELTEDRLPLRLVARDLPRSGTHLHITQFALVSDQSVCDEPVIGFQSGHSLRIQGIFQPRKIKKSL